MNQQRRVTAVFFDRFKEQPRILVRAPGRVNLIGEHTDYNDGFVLPMAIDRSIWIALRPRSDGQVRLYSLDFMNEASFNLTSFSHEDGSWIEYVKGVAWALQDEGYELTGWEGVIGGNVPIGAGLSSSAALEIALTRAFSAVSGLAWDPALMARLCQRADNVWVGIQSGIMDQMISAAGRRDHALLIDCRSLATEFVPLPQGTAVIVLDTNTRRGLVDSAYNERREQCEAAAAFFGVPALRDLTEAAFSAGAVALDELTRRRARHVVSENQRVLAAKQAMLGDDPLTLGRLMNASHESLRDDFAVSSAELDAMVEIAREQLGCLGARMTGAGFGGCAVALVREADAERFMVHVEPAYQAATGHSPNIYRCQPADGAERLNL